MLKSTVIKGYILLKSGLHIGGSEAGIHIGGIDNPVIKNPVTNLPYIPGSSLKGKVRFLLEHFHNLVDPQGSGDIPAYTPDNNIAKMFGHLNHNNYPNTYPTRVVFRDANLVGIIDNPLIDKQALNESKINKNINEIREKLGTDFVEAKTEVKIDRKTGTAKSGALRTIERVPAGVVFEFEVCLKEFTEEDKDDLKILINGLKLLENDALGGSGSRGSGRIQFFGVKKLSGTEDSNFELS